MYLGFSPIKIFLWYLVVMIVLAIFYVKMAGGLIITKTLYTTVTPIVLIFTVITFSYLVLYRINVNKRARCTLETKGVVIEMRHSNIRIGEEWLINIKVSYDGIIQEIRGLEPDFQFILSEGCTLPLKCNPDNLEEVVIDYDKLEKGPAKATDDFSNPINVVENTANLHVKGRGNARVESMDALSENFYRLGLRVYLESGIEPYSVVKELKLPDVLVAKLSPGSFIPCYVDPNNFGEVTLHFIEKD